VEGGGGGRWCLLSSGGRGAGRLAGVVGVWGGMLGGVRREVWGLGLVGVGGGSGGVGLGNGVSLVSLCMRDWCGLCGGVGRGVLKGGVKKEWVRCNPKRDFCG